MAYGTPANPVPATVITTAYAIANILDPLRALRANSGNADPPALNRVAISTGVGGPTAWMQIPTDAIADAAITDAKLVSQKVAQQNPVYTSFAAAVAGRSGMFDIDGGAGDAPVASHAVWELLQMRHWNTGVDYRTQIAVAFDDPNESYIRSVVAGAATPWRRLWHGGNDSALPNVVRTNVTSTVVTGQRIDFAAGDQIKLGLMPGGAHGLGTLGTTAYVNTQRYVGFHNNAASAGDYSLIIDTQTHAATFQGVIAAAGAVFAGNVQAATISGAATAQFAAAANGCPPGLIGAFATAAGIPAGWSRYTNGDGRLLVGAGTTFGQSFTENTAVGSTWAPSSTAGVSGNPSTTQGVQGGSGATVAGNDHGHTINVAGTAWTPVARVVVWAQKS